MSDMTVGRANAQPGSGVKPGGKSAEKAERRESPQQPPREQRRYDTVELSGRVMPGVRRTASRNDGDPDAALAPLLRQAGEKLDSRLTALYGGAPLAGSLSAPEPPVRRADEPDEAWGRRRADYEAAGSFVAHYRTWLEDSGGWSAEDRQRYLNEQSSKWAGELMRRRPEQFRAWLARGSALIEAGRADLCVLPRGFTAEDCRAWME